jgi:ABC-2 type transport system permease protein
MRLVVAQWRMELATLLRNYEQLLLVVVIPVGVLLFFGNVDVLPEGVGLARVVSSVLALSVMSTAMVSTGIATGFERSYGVLKRLGATPLGRGRLVWAKAAAVGTVEIVQTALIVAVAMAMGWSAASATWWRVLVAMLLGTFAFAGIGLALAGSLRAEVNLAAQNGLYLVLLAVGGVIVPVDELPSALGGVAKWLPSGALSDVLHASLAPSTSAASSAWTVVAAWAAVMPVVAARLFRFDD